MLSTKLKQQTSAVKKIACQQRRQLNSLPRPSDAVPSTSKQHLPVPDFSSSAVVERTRGTTSTDLNNLTESFDGKSDKQSVIDALWERAVRAPAAVVGASPRIGRPLRPSLLEVSTPLARQLKGTTSRLRRREGQTPHEARTVNETISTIIEDLDRNCSTYRSPQDWGSTFRSPGAPTSSWSTLVPSSSRTQSRNPVKEVDTPELAFEIESLVEELSVIPTDVEVVGWTKKRLFSPRIGVTGQPEFPRSYPRVLAHALRIVRTQFNNPHLALALFRHAQTLSVESYLSGCQTSAYNELLRARWESFRDLEGVNAGVREMEVNGVAWDRHTAALINEVLNSVGEEMIGRFGNTHRWGQESYNQLLNLERRYSEDARRQEIFYNRRQESKRIGKRSPALGSHISHSTN